MPPSAIQEIMPLSHWMSLPENRPLIVAGPCSVESQQQLKTTAQAIVAGKRVQVLRSGVWKPRSKPGQFEGLGEKALPWVRQVSNDFGLLAAVEVAKPKQVELCLKHRIDMMWLGARTTVNPFMVQDIAESLKGTDTAVMIKNPVCPDLHLWIGTIERILGAGIKKIIAVHRGFFINKKSKYRNMPLWDLPLTLKKEIPGLPLICDPSHIAGQSKLVAEIAAHALALNMNGLMVEVHHDPENALTDPLQQITPQKLHDILTELLDCNTAQTPLHKLKAIRNLIDENDYGMLELLSERMALVKEIGELKKVSETVVLQTERLKDIIADRQQKAAELGLSTSFVNEIMQLIHKESVAIQST